MTKDYSGQNLRGRSFKGQDLTGANFSGADIRGADFSNANLRGANFTGAKAGLQRRWAIFLVFISWLLSGILGFFFAFLGAVIALIFNGSSLADKYAGGIVLIVVIALIIIIIRQGLNSAFAFTVATGIAVAVAFIFTITISVAFAGANTFAGAGAVSGAVALSTAFVLAFAGAFSISLAFAVSGVLAAAFTGFGTFAGASVKALTFVEFNTVTIVGAFALALAGALLSAYIAWQAIKEDDKYYLIRNITVAAFGGTSFRKANLTNTNFTGATLRNTDFNQAILIRTYFHKTQKIDYAHPGFTYLQDVQVREVLVSGRGQKKNFNYQVLRGINFERANLQDVSFISADLSKANLKDANLSRAKLVQTQLDGTDFTGATLTGATIEDWGITSHTKLHGVRCEYVFMRSPTPDDPNPCRKPDNWNETFADGDFADFIKPIVDTLDLYHNSGVDPRAIATAFKQLAEDNPNAELEIVAIERRGEDKILLRAQTAIAANKSELSKEYFINYNQLKALAEREFKELIASQTVQISRLENMITTALERPSFYAQTYNNQGDTKMTGDRNINTAGGNYNERIEHDYIQGNYYATGQPQNLAQAAAEIQQLLKQLEQTYPTTTTSQQMVVAAEAINRIENNPTMKQKVINAVKEGGLAAFEKAIDNPAGAFVVGAIKGWQEIEAKD